MKRIHPDRRFAVQTTALLVMSALVGCRGTQTAMTNPFLVPDRVPPPATRMVAPGTAQPYYPGDPLPAVQGATTSAAPPVTAWQSTQPTSELAAASVPNAAATSPEFIASSEPSVSIPSDNSRLRFELPPPLPPVAESMPQVPTGTPAVFAVQNPPASSVVPAVYDQANTYQVMPTNSADLADSGPWRAPRIPQSNVAPLAIPNSQPMTVQPTLAATPQYYLPPPAQPQPVMPIAPAAPATMPVQLRAVPSPPLDNATTVPPRIRFAGPPTSPVMPPGGWMNTPVGQAAYISSTPGTVVQTVQITELPTSGGYRPGAVPSVASAPQGEMATSSDGFRPRGSTR